MPSRNINLTTTSHSIRPARQLHRSWWLRAVGFVALIITIGALSRSSSAEFEVPYIDPAELPSNVEFRGVWAFNRGFAYGANNAYEAFAVGVNTDIVDGTGDSVINCTTGRKEDCNGVFLYYNGTSWKSVKNIFTTDNNVGIPYSLNAMVGQEQDGGGPLWVVGPNGKISWIPFYYSTPGNTLNMGTSGSFPAIFRADTFTTSNTQLVEEERDFYAIDAARGYHLSALAGGQKGLVAATSARGSGLGYWNVITPVVTDTVDALHTNINTETVTAIKYANQSTIYVLTSTFDADDSDGGLPYAPNKHTCDGGPSYLYKVSVTNMSSWTRLAKLNSTCGYSLAVSTPSTSPLTKGPLQNIIWMATETGLWKYDESTGAVPQLASGTGASLYAVTAVQDRGGEGTNLLSNGNFDNHTVTPTIAAPLASNFRPDGWLYYDLAPGPNHGVAGTCNLGGNSSDYQMTEGKDGTDFSAIQVYPSPSYPGSFTCAPAKLNLSYTEGAQQLVPLSTIEGQKFRVTGWVKVEFPQAVDDPTANPKPAVDATLAGYPTAPTPQGGVSIGCDGPVNTSDPGFTNCSLSNRSYITVDNGNHIGTLNEAGVPGWKKIDLTISREDGLLQSIASKSSTLNQITPRLMYLRIVCEATYGARVTCDDLKVEEISTPPIKARDTYTVIAAGPNIAANGIKVNTDALNPASIFSEESLPAKVRYEAVSGKFNNINSLAAVGLQHIFAVGSGTTATGVTLFSRTPSTLTGKIFTVATSPTGSGLTQPVGNISVSCIDADPITPTQPQSLCQSNPESYGLSLEITSNFNATKTGGLVGRAWYGKSALGADETESLDLGICLRDPQAATLLTAFWGGEMISYDLIAEMHGSGKGNCNKTARRCWETRTWSADYSMMLSGTLSDHSCLTDFDCYGRCSKDEGFLCVKDGDCRLDSSTFAGWNDTNWYANPLPGYDWTSLNDIPGYRLQCSKDSPLACSSLGWLSFNASDFPLAGATTPPTGTFGVSYNTLFTGCNTTIDTTDKPKNHCRGDITQDCNSDAECRISGEGAKGDHNISFTTNNNQGAHELSGWGRFMSLADGVCKMAPATSCVSDAICGANGPCVNSSDKNSSPSGWVSFRGEEVPVVPLSLTSNSLFGCRNCDGAPYDQRNCAFCQDAANHSCVPSSVPGVSQCYNVCKNDHTKHCSYSTDCTTQGVDGSCISPGYCSELFSNNSAKFCDDDTNCLTTAGGPGGTCVFGAVCKSEGARCAKYGVNLDTETGKFSGYAWSQDFGWLDFRVVTYGTGRVIQTKLGDIYAGGQIGETGNAISPTCNATYLITSASTITSFCSSLGSTGLQQNVASIPLISAENSYQNILGRFDIKGMETVTSGNKNKYGTEVVDFTVDLLGGTRIDTVWKNEFSAGALGGKVYVVGSAGGTTEYSIDDLLTFTNGAAGAPVTSGAGILIVNGDLKINSEMSYGGSTVISDLRQLASLTIVVKGDLTIDNEVQNIVGAYYVTGKLITASEKAASNNQYPLRVYGLLIAKEFEFGRQFAGTIENPTASELIVYDGRLQSNPMLGMVDFTSALPNTVE